MLICGWAEGGRWELAAATGREAARAGPAGSVGTGGGMIVHGVVGGADTVRHQAHGARPPRWLALTVAGAEPPLVVEFRTTTR